ncbi:MAG: hypothetical protein IKQ57_06955 [Candidatus Methanomethylophilaceae archaeon]|nr:hypothetical protein [Candidatus Methanomethylophilaceae archaeon]
MTVFRTIDSAEVVTHSHSGDRKFILVQVPEPTESNKDASKDGFKTICDIGIKRIDLAGKSISSRIDGSNADIGYRVFEITEPMMQDSYYSPKSIKQSNLEGFVDNINPSFSADHLSMLFNVLLDWGLKISDHVSKLDFDGIDVYSVGDNDLVSCFDRNVDQKTFEAIARIKPTYAVFRDASFTDSSSKINLGEIFKNLSPETTVKVI